MEEKYNDILTVEDAAELLLIPISSVYKLASEGKSPRKRVERHWRFHRETLINWIALNSALESEYVEVGDI